MRLSSQVNRSRTLKRCWTSTLELPRTMLVRHFPLCRETDAHVRATAIPIQLARLHFVTAQHHLVRGWAPPRELDDEANDPADGADIEMSDGDPGEPAKNPDLADFFDEDRVRDVAAQALAQVGFDLVEVRLRLPNSLGSVAEPYAMSTRAPKFGMSCATLSWTCSEEAIPTRKQRTKIPSEPLRVPTLLDC